MSSSYTKGWGEPFAGAVKDLNFKDLPPSLTKG